MTSLNTSGSLLDKTVIFQHYKQETSSTSMGDFLDIDLGDLLSDQEQDFDSLQRHAQELQEMITAKKPVAAMVTRESYIKHLWARSQSRNAQIYRVANTDDKQKLTYFTKKEVATMETTLFNAFDALSEYQATLQPMDHQSRSNAVAAVPQGFVNNESHVRLARIEIPKFSGNQTEWQSFRDMFSSLVRNNRTLGTCAPL